MPGKGKSRAAVRRDEDRVREVQKFCEDGAGCRRGFMIRYFGQAFSDAQCGASCSNCYARLKLAGIGAGPLTAQVAGWLRDHNDAPAPVPPPKAAKTSRGQGGDLPFAEFDEAFAAARNSDDEEGGRGRGRSRGAPAVRKRKRSGSGGGSSLPRVHVDGEQKKKKRWGRFNKLARKKR